MNTFLIYINTMVYLGVATICFDHDIRPYSFEFWLILFGLVVLTLTNGLCFPREEYKKPQKLVLQQCPNCNHRTHSIKPMNFCAYCGGPLPKENIDNNDDKNNENPDETNSKKKDDSNQ